MRANTGKKKKAKNRGGFDVEGFEATE